MGNKQVVASTIIDASSEEIWAFLAEANRFAEWVDATKEVLSFDEGRPFGVDFVYKEHGGIFPFFSKSHWIVTSYTPYTKQVHTGDDGKVKMPLDICLESLPSETAAGHERKTRLTISLGLNPRWFVNLPLGILWPCVMRRKAQASMDRTVANAKRLVEAEAIKLVEHDA